MNFYHHEFIGVYENVFSKEWCQALIDFYNQSSLEQKRLTQFDYNEQLKDSYIQGDLVPLKLKEHFYKILHKNIIPLYIKKYPFAQEDYREFEIHDFRIQKTNPSEGYHIWHYERGPHPIANNRFGVYTIYLNDIEEGGETEFLYQSKRVAPKRGTLCIFPASYTHVHRGNPPLSGVKYIATGWFRWNEDILNKNINR